MEAKGIQPAGANSPVIYIGRRRGENISRDFVDWSRGFWVLIQNDFTFYKKTFRNIAKIFFSQMNVSKIHYIYFER